MRGGDTVSRSRTPGCWGGQKGWGGAGKLCNAHPPAPVRVGTEELNPAASPLPTCRQREAVTVARQALCLQPGCPKPPPHQRERSERRLRAAGAPAPGGGTGPARGAVGWGEAGRATTEPQSCSLRAPPRPPCPPQRRAVLGQGRCSLKVSSARAPLLQQKGFKNLFCVWTSGPPEHVPAPGPQAGAHLAFSDRPLPGGSPPARAPGRPLPPSHRCLHPSPWLHGHRRRHVATAPTAPGVGAAPGIAVRWWSGPAGTTGALPRCRWAPRLPSPLPAGSVGDGCPHPHERLARGHRGGAELSRSCCGPWTDGGGGRRGRGKRRSCSASPHAGTSPRGGSGLPLAPAPQCRARRGAAKAKRPPKSHLGTGAGSG